MSDFFENYKHPLWQKKRLEIMQAAGFQCQDCGSKDTTLNVHHAYYIKGNKPWEYPDEDLRCTCEGCHKRRHGQLTSLKAVIGMLPPGEIDQVIGYAVGVYLTSRLPTKHHGLKGSFNWFHLTGCIQAVLSGYPTTEVIDKFLEMGADERFTKEMICNLQKDYYLNYTSSEDKE